MRDDLRSPSAADGRPGLLVVAAACAALLACAGPAPKQRSILAGAAARSVLILPLNATAILSPELEPLRAPVWSELEIYLRADGVQLRTASFADARRLWLRSIERARAEAAGARTGFDDAARLLVLELGKHAEFDTLIIPSLFIRKASIEGDTASWDGVERPLAFRRAGRKVDDPGADTSFVGVAPAASLHAVVLDAQGNKLQDAAGGLELLAFVRVKETDRSPGGGPGLELVPRRGDFPKPENVREGIAVALAPFFPPPLPARGP